MASTAKKTATKKTATRTAKKAVKTTAKAAGKTAGKKTGKKTGKTKSAGKKPAAPRRSHTVADIVHVQQRAVQRMARALSSVAGRVGRGSYDLVGWADDYVDLMVGLSEDAGAALRAMRPRTRSRTA